MASDGHRPVLVARRKSDSLYLPSPRQTADHRAHRRPAVGGQGAIRQPVEHGPVPGLDWSADRGLVGTYMVSQSEVTSLELWPTANPDADKPDRVLVPSPTRGLWQAEVSPDGRWLSFSLSDVIARHAELCVAPAGGSASRAAGGESPLIMSGPTSRDGRRTAGRSISSHGGPRRTSTCGQSGSTQNGARRLTHPSRSLISIPRVWLSRLK